MRIFNAHDGDPMLMSTRQGMAELKKKFKSFVLSPDENASFNAETTGSPEPYEEFLRGLRIKKSKGPAQLRITEDKWLEFLGGEGALAEFELRLGVEKDGDHSHFYSSPISLIIEVDESWPGWDES